MDQDRIIRMSFPGIAFIVTIFLWDYILGGSFYLRIINITQGTNETINLGLASFLLGLIISTPFLGFVLSSIPYAFLTAERCFRIPDTLRPGYLEALRRISNQNVTNISHEQLTSIHQPVIREEMSDEAVKYTTRRFTFFVTHINMIFSIAISFFIVSLVHIINGTSFIVPEENCAIMTIKIAIIGIYLGYIVAGIISAGRIKRESNEFEINWVINSANKLNNPPLTAIPDRRDSKS